MNNKRTDDILKGLREPTYSIPVETQSPTFSKEISDEGTVSEESKCTSLAHHFKEGSITCDCGLKFPRTSLPNPPEEIQSDAKDCKCGCGGNNSYCDTHHCSDECRKYNGTRSIVQAPVQDGVQDAGQSWEESFRKFNDKLNPPFTKADIGIIGRFMVEYPLDSYSKGYTDAQNNLQSLLKEEAEKLVEVYESLKGMFEQYCPGEYGHNFMSAGENAELILEKYSYLSDGGEK